MANLGCSFMQEINKTESAIKECYERVTKLEEQLRLNDFPPEKQSSMKLELEEVKKLLATNNEILKKMHKHNRGNFFIAFALLILCVAFFILFQTMRDNFDSWLC
ncbi:hypothetical protein HHI36_018426 [Cryptolaemus montrouzieri]|uniref:Coiled-coil domain-containing protein 167 n=1 Tax=Cryptolaemus montrouzieri TaxID=559131 RepID=A0ABD2P050_9CUCU